MPRIASGRAIDRGAKAIREARNAGKPRRGKTTTAEERATAAALEARLRTRGLDAAKVEAVASKPGATSVAKIVVPIDRLADLARAIDHVVKAKTRR